ncbi:MAG: hypothetical protein KAG14_00315 [Mycoplasmataceae bacterium]|nr:hypothetical protein [Mycoplasmataceae bacterium]
MNTKEIVTKNENIIHSIESFFNRRTTKGVLSGESSAVWWGFSDVIPQTWHITVPGSYNATNKSSSFIFKKMNVKKYEIDIKRFSTDQGEIRVYSPERTIVEIIKSAKGNYTDVILQTIKNFFSTIKYQTKKLINIAKTFNVERELLAFKGAFGG